MNLRTRFAPRTDAFRCVDLADFPNRRLQPGASGTLRWSRQGREVASIGYRVEAHRLVLSYTATIRGERRDVDDPIAFTFTEQPFGGVRKWFACPACQRRCRVLYGGAYFRCRVCRGAVYESQYETFRVAGLNRAARIRQKLKGELGFMYPFPDRPKGMHWRTWLKLREEDWRASERLDRLLETVR